jgi:hypothetical protein
MFKWMATVVITLAILAAAALIVGEMRYRDCLHQRDAQFHAAGGNSGNSGYLLGPKLSYAGCSHSPF